MLYTFGASQYDAVRPAYGPIKVGNFLYGATEYGGRWDKGAIFAFNLSKGTERVLYSFGYYVGDSNPFTSDGILPEGGLINLNGVLYGTTAQGGLYDNCYYGCGTVFGVNIATAKEELFYAFPGTSGDVYEPAPQLVDQSGVLYSMGYGGEFGDGAIFSLDPATATEKTLYSFPAALGAQLSLSLNGLIYGTTIQGGTAACGGKGCGTIFTFSP